MCWFGMNSGSTKSMLAGFGSSIRESVPYERPCIDILRNSIMLQVKVPVLSEKM